MDCLRIQASLMRRPDLETVISMYHLIALTAYIKAIVSILRQAFNFQQA